MTVRRGQSSGLRSKGKPNIVCERLGSVFHFGLLKRGSRAIHRRSVFERAMSSDEQRVAGGLLIRISTLGSVSFSTCVEVVERDGGGCAVIGGKNKVLKPQLFVPEAELQLFGSCVFGIGMCDGEKRNSGRSKDDKLVHGQQSKIYLQLQIMFYIPTYDTRF